MSIKRRYGAMEAEKEVLLERQSLDESCLLAVASKKKNNQQQEEVLIFAGATEGQLEHVRI